MTYTSTIFHVPIFRNGIGKVGSQFLWEEIFRHHNEHFPHAENLELLFFLR